MRMTTKLVLVLALLFGYTTPGAGQDVIKCAGLFGTTCGQPQSKYKTTMRLSYLDGPALLSLAWRHLSRVHDDDPTTDYTTETIKACNPDIVIVATGSDPNLPNNCDADSVLSRELGRQVLPDIAGLDGGATFLQRR